MLTSAPHPTHTQVDVIPQIRLMKFLLQAITRNSHKIWLTVLLCLVVLYVFSTISYLVFQDQYGFEQHYDCNSLITCFKLHLDYGINNPPTWKGNGAIDPDVHTTLVQNPQERGSFDFAMVILSSLFNLSYVILVNLVLTAIIAGASLGLGLGLGLGWLKCCFLSWTLRRRSTDVIFPPVHLQV